MFLELLKIMEDEIYIIYICQTIVYRVHLAKNVSSCLNRMHVSFFIQLTNIFESSLDVRLCSGSVI